jgi:FkbM family methyltransferase
MSPSKASHSALVYDIGLHDGRDTGHYLREGCCVVAVDANTAMCAAAHAVFNNHIRTGQLTIINSGITEQKGQLEFWVCEDASEWSSFHVDIASRRGAKHHAVTVDCVPIMDLIHEFGVADYMKIDIELNDRVCIDGLTSAVAPRYISIEVDIDDGEQDIQKLFDLGYREFKVICQSNSWHQVTTRNMWAYKLLARNKYLIPRCWRKLRRISSKYLSGRRLGESGPWGEKTSGSWHSADHARSVWRSIHELDKRLNVHGLGEWYDIHAKK